ncbi:MAG: LD-carboxypeptidase [Pseudobdellovibrionaceae bacterium]
MKFTAPPPLKKGDTIGIVATARWRAPEGLQRAKSHLEVLGYKVKIHPNNALRLHEWAGSPKERGAAFTDYWCDPEIKMILCAAGGTRTLHMMQYLDWEKLKGYNKIIMGFSDATALINALSVRLNIVTYHGPDAGHFSREEPQPFIDDFLVHLTGEPETEDKWDEARILRYGEASGELVGGNLCIFNYLMGTKDQPDLKGKILFIEDEMEELRNIDRMLIHLKRAGHMEHIAGLMVGGFTMNLNGGRVPFPYTVEDLINEHTEGMHIPVIMDAPFGHGESMKILPIGMKATLKAVKTGVTFKLG